MNDAMPVRPDWAYGMTDLHVHSAPSLMPRHGTDSETVAAERAEGVVNIVLKSHEGSTVERAALAGDGVYGGIVLNSAVGGANPDAVEIAARLGGRVVWAPTISSRNHQAASSSSALSVHQHVTLRTVPVMESGKLRPEWYDVLNVIAAHDLLLASGHLAVEETIVLFTAARERGVQRLLVNHPMMSFMRWDDPLGPELRRLGAHLELGILPDLLTRPPDASLSLLRSYPHELLVFGADLGHADHPTPARIMPAWLRKLEAHAGAAARTITTTNSEQLLLP